MSAMAPDGRELWLVADIGGTHLRVALCPADGSVPDRLETLRVAAFPQLEEALEGYLARHHCQPGAACLAVAGPVAGDQFRFTNSPWAFSRDGLRRRLRLARLLVRNDFEALALSLPTLAASDLLPIGGGTREPGRPMAVLGPGSGLGVATLVPSGAAAIALPGEGGHAGFAPQDALEIEIVRVLRRNPARICNETLLSGPGLATLYGAIAAVEGVRADTLDAPQVTERGLAGTDALAVRSLDVFCAILGSVAGDVALTVGARGGVFIGGGIAPRLLPILPASRFRARFEDKGAQSAYTAGIATAIIVAPVPALYGALAALRSGALA